MKKLVCGLIMLFLISCSGMQVGVKEEAIDVAIEVSAFTLGYEGCKKNTVTFKELASIADTGIKLVELNEITLNELMEKLRERGAETISSDPLTQYQIKKLLSLLDVNLEADVIDIDESKNKYVFLALNAFIEGVGACVK